MAEALDLLVQCLRMTPAASDSASLEIAQRTVDLKRQLYGDTSADLARSQIYQASLLQSHGSSDAARPLLDLAIRMTEEALGPTHPQVALALYEQALLNDEIGQYDRAIASCERALQILEATAPLDSTLTSAALNLLSLDRLWVSDYTAALAAIDRAIAIRKAMFGDDHPRVQGIVNNRAAMLYSMGDVEAARRSFVQILESLRRTLDDPGDPRIGVAWLNLGTTTMHHDPVGCRSSMLKAQEILEERFGPNHEKVVKCISNLGVSYYLSGDLHRARSMFEEGLKRQESAAPIHDLAASLLHWLAAVDYELGDFASARLACERALTISTETLGPDNPETAKVHVLLGAVLGQLGETQAARSHSLQAERIGAAHLRLMSRGFAEREALLYAQERPRGLDLPLSLLAETDDAKRTRQVWDVAMRSRALVYDEMAARRRSTTLARDPEVAQLYSELRRASTRLSQLIVAGPGNDPEAHHRELATAREEKETIEKALAQRSTPVAAEMLGERAGLSDISKHVPAGWALVSFVVYTQPSAHLAPGVQRYGLRPEAEIPYLHAFVLGARGSIRSVPIGPMSEIESLVAAWSTEIAGKSGKDLRSKATLSDYRRVASALRAKVWDPLIPLLENADHILIVPDGILQRLSFATLPLGEDDYLVDLGIRFHYLGAERDLIGTGAPERSVSLQGGRGLLALGNIDFSAAPEPPASDVPATPEKAPSTLALAGSQTRGGSMPCEGLVAVVFPPLPGTAREIERLTTLWQRIRVDASSSNGQPLGPLTLLRGADATEQAFKSQSSGYRFMHIATHGFFLGPDCEATPELTRGIHPVPLRPRPAGPAPSNMLSLSGLVLAGANHRDEIGPGQEDGILTAEEVAALDLQGLEWAVLSGCDTGVGTIQSGEGVLGLRRAFRIAGARTLIMSLWSVSDRATVEWMDALYTSRLVDGAHTIDAVHAATRSVLESRRQRGESTHPFYWGGFVATGEWSE